MTTCTAKISVKNQITVPSEVRKALDLQPQDRIRFEMKDGEVRVVKAEQSIEFMDMMGILKAPTNQEPFDIDRAIHDAQQERADEIMRNIGEW